MDIGSLTGAISLEDQISDNLTLISARVKKFADNFDGAFGAAAVAAGVVTAAVAGAVVSITALGEKGSTILGVEDAFNRLAVAAGSTGDALIGGLNEGVKDTVDSMVLMQSVNRALSAGVKLSAADMQVLGETARAMGKATGTDAADGLNTLTSALTTGQTRGLRMAGILIDVEKAEDKFAASIGRTRDQLNDAGKLEAKRIAMLEAMRAKVQLLGVSELNFKERVQQSMVALGNWTDNLAKAVASSPNVLRAYDDISESLQKAFGATSQTLLSTIVGWVNKSADAVSKYGPMVIQTVADIKDGVVRIWNAVRAAWDTVPDWFKAIARDAALASIAVGGVSIVTKGLTGGDVLTGAAAIANIWSAWGANASRAVVHVKSLYQALSVYYLLGSFAGGGIAGGIGGILTGIGAGITTIAATPLGIAALVAALGAAFVQLGEGVKKAGEAWRANKSMWDFFTAKEDDNFVRRWLGLTKTPTPPGKADVSQYQTAEQAAAALIKPPITPPVSPDFIKDDFGDKVKALAKSWREASMDAGVFAAAFGGLSKAQLANRDVQQMLLPEILKLNEAGKAIPVAMRAEADAIAASDLALRTKGFNLLATNNITLDYVEAQKRMGLSEAQIALNLNVTSIALQTRIKYLEDMKRVSTVTPLTSLPGLSVGDTDGKAFAAAQAAQYAAYKSFSDKVRQLGMESTAKALDNIKIEKDAAILALGLRTSENVAFYDKSRKLIDVYYQHETDIARNSANVIVEIMNQRGVKTQAQLDTIAFQEIALYNRMTEAGNTWSKKAIQQQKDVADAAVNAAKGTEDAWEDALKRIPDLVVSAMTGGGGVSGALQGVGSMLGATLGKTIGKGISSLGKFGGPIGEAIGSLAGPLIGMFVNMFGSAGRDAIKAFGKELTGTTDLNALHTLLQQQLPDEAEKYWIILTQGTERNNAAQAAANIQKVRDALANSPEALASAAGYKTIEELQAVADKAKTVYDYMVASGKYGAAAIEAAFKAANEAAQAAMGDEALAHQKSLDEITERYKGMFDKLDSEYKSLSDSVGAEAEEAYMGVVETQQRARMAQIEIEKKALEEKKAAEESAADQVYNDWLEAGKITDAALRELFQKPYKIPVEWEYGGSRPGFAETPGDSGIPPGTVPTSNASAPAAASHGGEVRIKFPGSAMAELVVPFIPGVVQDFGVG